MNAIGKHLFLGLTTGLYLVGPRPAFGQEASPAPLRLSDLIRVALENGPRVRQAQARRERTEGQVQRTLAPFRRPTLTLTGSYNRLSSSNAQSSSVAGTAVQNPFTVGLSGSSPGAQSVQLSNGTTSTTRSRQAGGGTTGPNDTFPDLNLSTFGFTTALNRQSAGVTLAQRIDLTGLARAYQRAGAAETALARQDVEQARQETVYDVTAAYYAALRAEALIRVSEASVAQSREQVRIAQARFDQGSYARSDVLRAGSQFANNEQSLVSARNQARISLTTLANSAGIDPAAPLPLAAEEANAAALPDLPELDEAALTARALARRPEAVRAALNERKAGLNVRIARGGQEPYLTASVNGNYDGSQGIASSRRATGSVGATLTFPLSDGGVTAAGVRMARADARLAAAQRDEYRIGVTAEVRQAVIAVRDAHDRARSALPALEEAREGYRLSEARLAAGSGTALSLYDAQAALIQAEVNAINARYDYRSALARLARYTGGEVAP